MEGHSSRSSWATSICSRIGSAVFICREIAGDASIDLARGADRSRQDRRCHRYLFCSALTIRVSGNIWLPSNSDPLPILADRGTCSTKRLPHRSRSADRTRSTAPVSKKREFFKCPPETIGHLAVRMPKIRAWRLVTNSQKPAIGGPFCEYQGHFL